MSIHFTGLRGQKTAYRIRIFIFCLSFPVTKYVINSYKQFLDLENMYFLFYKFVESFIYNLYIFALFVSEVGNWQPASYRYVLFGRQRALKCMNVNAFRQGMQSLLHCTIPIFSAVLHPIIHILMLPTWSLWASKLAV